MPPHVLTTGAFSITTPESSTMTAGVVNIDMTPDGLGVVAKTAAHVFGPIEVDLLRSATRVLRWRPGFAGTLKRVSVVLSGATVATGPATVTVGVAGDRVVMDAIAFAPGQTSGAAQDVAITAGGAFTADQTIDITPGGTNSAAVFGVVIVEYTRT